VRTLQVLTGRDWPAGTYWQGLAGKDLLARANRPDGEPVRFGRALPSAIGEGGAFRRGGEQRGLQLAERPHLDLTHPFLRNAEPRAEILEGRAGLAEPPRPDDRQFALAQLLQRRPQPGAAAGTIEGGADRLVGQR